MLQQQQVQEASQLPLVQVLQPLLLFLMMGLQLGRLGRQLGLRYLLMLLLVRVLELLLLLLTVHDWLLLLLVLQELLLPHLRLNYTAARRAEVYDKCCQNSQFARSQESNSTELA